jgi:gliding motility-associated lipoprotein GldD
MSRYLVAFLLLLCMASCRPQVFPPKPEGYFRIDTPASHQYKLFDRPEYPYSFEYPVYSIIENDTVFQGEHADNPYWININFGKLGGVINITYKKITPAQPLTKLAEEAWGLSFFHHEKAEYMNEKEFSMPGKSVLLYTVGGNSASRYQFTATDSVKHFIRGALYFDVTPNADSLKPATDFIEQDIKHMLMTLRFK